MRYHSILCVIFLCTIILQISSSASAATKRSCLRELKKCGVDTKDDTELLNQIFSYSGKIKIPAGTYYVDATKGIHVISNTKVICKDGVEFRCIPNDKRSYNIFLIQDAKNVSFNGGKIIGDRNEHTGTGGEHGMGISIMDSKDVTIIGTMITDTWGDAIYVGSNRGSKGGQSENVKIQSCRLSNCRRQGVSVVACSGFTISDTEIYGINGTLPEAGIDFEVNYKQFPNAKLVVEHCDIHDCKGPSIVVGNPIEDLYVRNSTLDDLMSSMYSKNLVISHSMLKALTLGGVDGSASSCTISSVGLMNYGNFQFNNCQIERITSSKNTGIKDEDLSVSCTFCDCSFISPTENLSQEGRYAYETMAYFTVKPKSLKFDHCSFVLRDAWGLGVSVEDSLQLNHCIISYKPSKQASWGSGYGFLDLRSSKGSIIFEDNDVDAKQLTQYTAYGLIRAYAPEVRFNRNNVKTSVKNIGTHVVRANNEVNKVIEINDNTFQGYTKEGVFREGVKTKLSNIKIN